jgi:hypothetical protein
MTERVMARTACWAMGLKCEQLNRLQFLQTDNYTR